MNKNKIQEYDIGTDDDLNAQEKETTLTIPNDKDGVVIYSDVATMIKWVLSVSESEVIDHRLKNGEIVGVKARIPKGIVKLQGSARKSNAHSQMVSYGDEL
jgi:hypothetical protein